MEAVPVESDPSVLILPAFDYNLKERSDSRCSVCTTFQSSRKPQWIIGWDDEKNTEQSGKEKYREKKIEREWLHPLLGLQIVLM